VAQEATRERREMRMEKGSLEKWRVK